MTIRPLAIALALPLSLIVARAYASDLIEEAKSAVSYDMKDPSSVQFREVQVYQRRNAKTGEPMQVVCGQYNAKNSYGAYVGFKRFYYAEGTKILEKDAKDRFEAQFNKIFDELWKACANEPVNGSSDDAIQDTPQE